MSNVLSWNDFFLLRRCHGLPSLEEIKRQYEAMVSGNDPSIVDACLQTLDPVKKNRLAMLSGGMSLSLIARAEKASPSAVKRSLANAIKEVVEKVSLANSQREEEEEESYAHAEERSAFA